MRTLIKSKLLQKLVILVLVAVFTLGNTGEVMAVHFSGQGTISVSGWQDGNLPGVFAEYTSDSTSINFQSSIYPFSGPTLKSREGVQLNDPVKIIVNGAEYTAYTKHTINSGNYEYIFEPFRCYDLIPGSEYFMYVYYQDIHVETMNTHYGPATDMVTGNLRIYTDIIKPLKPYYQNIKDKSLTVKWDIINGNKTNYLVYRSASSSGPWTHLGTTSNNYFNDTGSGLVAEQTYYYYIVANHTGELVSQQIASDISTVLTTADPAVAAAQEAASAADAARESALLAQTASEKAESKASEAVELIKNLKTNFTDLEASFSPTILSVKGHNGATATKGNTFAVDVTASNAIYYRAGVNGNYTAWQQSPRINNISLPNSGVNTIEVQAKRSNAEDAPMASGYITVFKLN